MNEEKEGKNEKIISDIAKREEETLASWQSSHIFEKSLEQTNGGEEFVFYDGPPFATGLPHYGHMLASTIKDTIPRYQTMRGRYVRRVWGWDCHGLPIENLIEKELGLEHKKDIEEYGVEKFNEASRASVYRYDAEWKKFIPRIGRFVDMEHSYSTMDANYTESVWWAFKELFNKGLVYQGFKPMHICPRCETTLSNNEVTSNYKDITDISVTAKFELVKESGTFILAWTTTPWTLPGNVALAVSPDAEYIKVAIGDEKYILASERAEKALVGKEYAIISKMKGSELVGVEYKPIFNYYSEQGTLDNRENGWKVYGADFVTMESGTGVVHIAPAFGEDDMNLGAKENLPFVQHVAMDGTMKKEVRDFAGVSVKPKSDEKDGHQATDILIIKHLASIGALFSKEKIVHAYPHCWRCETPLLNYSAESWFVKVPELKDKLLSENAKTSWVPKNMRDGRYGKWLEGARDWAISRSRYWGAPIPVWQCEKCEAREVLGSRVELSERTKKSGSKYIVMRHGEAESNVKRIVSSKIDGSSAYGLTSNGRMLVEETGKKLKNNEIDIIITSPFVRTKETAEIVAGVIGFDTKKIIVDERIKEIDTGVFDGRSIDEYRGHFVSMAEKFTKRPEGGENLLDVKRRVMLFLEDLEKEYSGKTILIVTHEYPIWMLMTGIEGAGISRGVEIKDGKEDFVATGEVKEIQYAPFPHNADFEFDLHLPYIDKVEVLCACGGQMTRVPYVFDCWFESGSMPYAQFHYPFENKELFEKNFPADFIAEGVDQTRGWFYSMMVLSIALFGKAPFKNVIVNGMTLAEDGQKMSKSRKNYPDPVDVINKYGADAVRYYMLSSPIVHAEDLAFSERGVDEVVKKITMRITNVLSFYELYSAETPEVRSVHTNPLDHWILARLAELGGEMTGAFDRYELDRAVNPIGLFVDDLSTWYIRRSRDRFKSDEPKERAEALSTTRVVLLEFSKLLAPVMPFLAEHIYQSLQGAKESVHLDSWPTFAEPNYADLASMAQARRVVSLALEARAKAGIKVRQPLAKLTIKDTLLVGKKELADIILDELNVEEVVIDAGELAIELDTNITPALKRKGQYRDLLRTVQELRKQTGLTPSDVVELFVQTNDDGRALVEEFSADLKKASLLKEILFKEVHGEPVSIDGILFTLAIAE
ncbi:MAG: Isoleucine-tRNA ligase [Parcubacteria group bacterium GW2011_GWA1_44_13]|uniref:Isoleucine--tRNA ligase n=1 Tax=Candidatus Nomurabacteria bacterium GW2011_GWB1_44_12 TaxID=1618748 RepID=A0A837IAK5_9BACT|nr:MAG: Isoleucine-tRNA ligase [Candidatus Nomurabacteria bacterium GW2011_GWD1_44_10]KKT37001.1 MAG: Isoleucine-tRNA ligase [Candidatus Nomurabacteria bacterium GW2011_GWB1_44_12]KKT37820.1 MAG: Isoleucine-tRNA ligase [Parcubacteria group bacterium GW2011_GWA1_44_13]KKT60584.1 MAG: Isoleucine-tRNA ligase [Parcubacteria group bacterium GW2011_GWC1_44_26]